ncbi:MAG: WbqC family protein [Methanobacteriota archaeon]|nr:MAG: WbqC family protein [Euryarchaeota archaeon]
MVVYDTAQYSKNQYHNRNRIKTPGGPTWLTVPVRSPQKKPILSVEIDNSKDWGRRLSFMLEANYARSPWFSQHGTELGRLFRQSRWERLADLNIRLLSLITKALDIDTEIVRASALPAGSSEDPTDKLLAMTQAVGGDTYLSGPGGRTYLDRSKFDRIALRFSRPPQAVYPQLWGPFEPNLSIVDALFNCGTDTKNLLDL